MEGQDRKKIILLLRWTVIIVISYLILLGQGRLSNTHLVYIFVIGYIASNVVLTFLPKIWFSNPRFFYSLVVFDTGIISFGMYLSERVTTDFYLVFFLVIIFASMSRNFKLLMAIGAFTALLYGFLLYTWGLLNTDAGGSYTLRIPFIFIMAAFYGYLVQTFTKEKRRIITLSEDKYQGLFENANDGIILLTSPQFQIGDVNREVEKVTGFTKQELIGKQISVLSPTDEEKKAAGFFQEILEKGEGRTDSLSFIRKDGTTFEVDLSTKKINMGDQPFFQMIFRDLSEQRKLEKRIRESKRDLEAIFDGIRDQLSIQSPDFQIHRVNRTVIEKNHTTFQELIGKKCYEAYYQRTRPCEKCPAVATFQTRQPSNSVMKIPDSDTTLFISSYPILDEKEKIVSIIEHVRDITEEKRLQEQLIQSEKLAGIGILSSGVAHEINNPLTGIIGMAEIALEEGDSKTKDYLTDIIQCAQRIADIIKGLRSYSRVAKQEAYGFVEINGILEDSLKMVQLATKSDTAKVIKDLQSHEKIDANVGEIQHAFTNLITNAFQAMKGKPAVLRLSTRTVQNSVEVKVGDNGAGIPENHLTHIFEPFFTTRSPGEGIGLGLNIVYRIVAKYEGTIEVESKEGAGTTFIIKFPIRGKE